MDPGFRWGLGVFETLVYRARRVEFRDWHEDALKGAAGALGIAAPEPLPVSCPGTEDGIWRWFLTPEGFFHSFENGLEPVPDSMRMALSHLRLDSRSWEARFKTLSYLNRIQARRECGADEALMLNEHGRVASASMANVFLVREGRLVTPSLKEGCRNGVIRRWVMECSGMDVEEAPVTVDQLEEADEVFLTNSRIGIGPVRQCLDRWISSHPVTDSLRRLLRDGVLSSG